MHAMYEFGWKPSDWDKMPYAERQIVIQMMNYHHELQKEAEKEAEKKSKR